ncbi:hypothetical protein C7I84_04390 [Mesorhizobium ephedrae]|uniref:Peptidase M10 serralysin C-terminal domain-containing protein n=1 Tax=Kumtagia ephedrae TaxID=2116701 RepID=A0A2P7SQV0_9HYPH|nr:hypothetical protein C7I84_04390 [Mesorhizobium ephedrae]
MVGGAGSDIFVFDTALSQITNVDLIRDFVTAVDTIQLDNAIFDAILGTGTLSADQFVANASGTAQDASHRIIYEIDEGRLFYDADGNGAGESVIFTVLDNAPALSHADFVIV